MYKRQIEKRLQTCGLPTELMKGCRSLANIRKMIKNHLHDDLNSPKIFNTKISIHRDRVVIGKKAFTVTRKKAKNKLYPTIRFSIGSDRSSLNVNALAMALILSER